jgi:polar amino acid transport system permease protein
MSEWDFSFLVRRYHVILDGLYGTLALAAVTLAVSLLLGIIAGMGRTSRSAAIRAAATCYVEFFRNIPALVQVFWFFYVFPILTGVQENPFISAATALSFYSGAFFAEIYRSGIQSIERSQWDAGKALGFGYFRTMRYIVLPPAIKRMIPALTNQSIEVVKLTTVASTIAYHELLYQGQLLSQTEFRPLEAYTVVAVILIGILVLLSYGSTRLERRLARSE